MAKKNTKVKRNNKTSNKLRKQGKLHHKSNIKNIQKQKQPVQPQYHYDNESESSSGDDMADMLDEEERQYLLDSVAKEKHIFSTVEEEEPTKKSAKKRKKQEIEDKYEQELADQPVKKMRSLLPIKTKQGLMERSEEVDDSEDEQRDSKREEFETQSDNSEDSGIAVAEDGTETKDEVTSGVQPPVSRKDRLKHEKIRIGSLCASLVECPEKKLKNLYPILTLMDEKLKDGTLNLHKLRKFATLSAYEVFKDVLPEYAIKHQDYSNVKLKRETLGLYKIEEELLQFYLRYLRRLENAISGLRRKKSDTRKLSEREIELALTSLKCMCGVVSAKPNFNYSKNILQSIVPFLDSYHADARKAVTQCCIEIFNSDIKGAVTLTVVRLINQLAKRRGEHLHPEALDCLLSLKIDNVKLDAKTEIRNKKKQELKHKKRIVNLSKKEKKRAKKLKEVEQELLETEAQENEMERDQLLTQVADCLFQLYFRLLKTLPRSKLLAATLRGLAKFTHVINMDFYFDLVTILTRLLKDENIADLERLLCVHTALAILHECGDTLNVDPTTLHRYIYMQAGNMHAGNSMEGAQLLLDAISEIVSRARRASPAVLQAFAKRLATFSAQHVHNVALAALVILHRLRHQSKAVENLFELDAEGGSGKYDPLIDSPDHCNAQSSALFELCLLRRHYHPEVRITAAKMLTPQCTIPATLHKLSTHKILEKFEFADPWIYPDAKGK